MKLPVMIFHIAIFLFLNLFSSIIFAMHLSQDDLFRDLLIVDQVNQRINERLPVTYNHFLQGGYWSMPSARMGQEGEIGLGYADVPPYRLWNLRCQLTDRLEVAGNYRIFKGVKDPVLSQHGFGDFSDKGANFKVAIFHPEDSGYQLPGLALGFDDIIGTRAFKARYLVLTQVLLDYDIEMSLGYGQQRIGGWFGGLAWMPFRRSNNLLQNLAFVAEFDSTRYRSKHVEPHPKGREQRFPVNVGIKCRFLDQFDCSVSYIRGKKWAFSLSTFYNFGDSKGFITKIDNPMPYVAPVNLEPLGALRPENVLAADIIYAYRHQGFTVLDVWLGANECGEKELRIRIINEIYRLENDVRNHLNNLVAYLTPMDISRVIIGVDCEGAVIQEYRYNMEFARIFGNRGMGAYELKVLSPLCEESKPNICTDSLLYHQKRSPYCFDLLPKNYSCFGSSKGKFKYALGVQVLTSGYFADNIFYSVVLGYIGLKNIGDIKDFDRLNPSQLINVRTDIVRYYKQNGITLDEAYLQKFCNVGKGHYSRVSLGYFDVAYGGVAGEWLYYPVNSRWAFGVDGAIVLKRKVNNWLGFTTKIRKLDGFKPTYRNFVGSQYAFNLYYDWKEAKVELRLKVGKFLANDYGVRYELSRYFPSGLRITLWYTRTNGRDKINGQTYYDKGIYFTMPLDFFYTSCARGYWTYGMSAWLRDVGALTYTGQELYYMINDNRE